MVEPIIKATSLDEMDRPSVHFLLDELSSSITPEEAGDLNVSVTDRDLDILFNHGEPLEDSGVEHKSSGNLRAFGENLAGEVWPNKEMVYCFHPSLHSASRALMLKAMADISAQSCVRFREVPYSRWTTWRSCSEWDGIVLQSDEKGCFVGAGKGHKYWHGTTLNLETDESKKPPDTKCSLGTAKHEVLHGLGMAHEHTRTDRDKWITINWQNIKDDKQSKYQYEMDSNAGTSQPYDLGSIMHYSQWGFSRNGQKTFDLTWAGKQSSYIRSGHAVGQRFGLSASDWAQLQEAYTCAPYFQNQGRSCWSQCGQTGNCDWCGTRGACCRSGYDGHGCKGTEHSCFRHTCTVSSAPDSAR